MRVLVLLHVGGACRAQWIFAVALAAGARSTCRFHTERNGWSMAAGVSGKPWAGWKIDPDYRHPRHAALHR